jgi:hypothetical protein
MQSQLLKTSLDKLSIYILTPKSRVLKFKQTVQCYEHERVEAVRTSETSVYFNETTRQYMPQSCHLQTFHHKNLKYHIAKTFISHPKEGVLRIFITLKIPSPRPGFNPRSLGQDATTLTSTPPRRPFAIMIKRKHFHQHSKKVPVEMLIQ